jgi:hypothetical protein
MSTTQRATRSPLLVSVSEGAASLGVSTRYMWSLVRSDALPTVRLGRRVLVPMWALERIAGIGSSPAPVRDNPRIGAAFRRT